MCKKEVTKSPDACDLLKWVTSTELKPRPMGRTHVYFAWALTSNPPLDSEPRHSLSFFSTPILSRYLKWRRRVERLNYNALSIRSLKNRPQLTSISPSTLLKMVLLLVHRNGSSKMYVFSFFLLNSTLFCFTSTLVFFSVQKSLNGEIR